MNNFKKLLNVLVLSIGISITMVRPSLSEPGCTITEGIQIQAVGQVYKFGDLKIMSGTYYSEGKAIYFRIKGPNFYDEKRLIVGSSVNIKIPD